MDNGGDFLQLCRLCLVKDEVNIPIFEEQGDIRQIIQKISSCLPVKVSREDKLPKKICDGCSYKLDMVYEFWNTTANAEKQLLTWLGEAEMKSKLTENATSAVAQQLKPAETVVKQETIDPSDIHTEENDDDKTYMFQQKFSSEEAGPSATATSNDEPPPKRARRTAAVKAQIAMDPESDDDDDSGEPVTKVEDESEESEGEDHDASYADVPSTSADDQPGPSGVGKDGADAPYSNGNSDIRCYLCDLTFTSETKLQVHLENLEAFLKVFCKHCKSFIRFEDAALHFDVSYSCILCKLILSGHHFLEHNCFHKPLSQEIASTKREKCEECGNLFFSNTDMEGHIKENHSSNFTNFCRCCRIRFKTNEEYSAHIGSHAKEESDVLQSQTYRCKYCDVEFPRQRSLTVHTRIVHRN